ncbi:MAG: DUF805 domain-containing protein [Candidatus Paceibacterota bacterium]
MENMFTLEGRIGRLDYFFILLIHVIFNVLIVLLNPESVLILILVIPVSLGVFWLYVCAIVKRFHDLNKSGSNFWLLLIPIYNIYLTLGLLLFRKGTNGSNMYGENPVENGSIFLKQETVITKESNKVDVEKVMLILFVILFFLGIVWSLISM